MNILGAENILTLPETIYESEVKDLPSPDSLKEKYILKSLRPLLIPTKNPDDDAVLEDIVEGGILDIFAVDDPEFQKPPPVKKMSDKAVSYILPKEEESKKLDEAKNDQKPSENKIESKSEQKVETEQKIEKIMLAEKLVNAVYLICGVKFELGKTRYPWELTSVSSKRYNEIMNKDNEKFLKYTSKNLLCVNPSFTTNSELKSSHDVIQINPYDMWKNGIQLAGIFRTLKNDYCAINDALFYQGGAQTGYILKHQRILYENINSLKAAEFKPSKTRKIKIQFISVNQIPLEQEFMNDTNFTIQMNIKGDPTDVKTNEIKFQSNGFKYIFDNPDEPAIMNFTISYPLEAVFLVSLLCEGKIICKAAFPAISMRQGYRTIQLCDQNYAPYAFSCILAKFEILDN